MKKPNTDKPNADTSSESRWQGLMEFFSFENRRSNSVRADAVSRPSAMDQSATDQSDLDESALIQKERLDAWRFADSIQQDALTRLS